MASITIASIRKQRAKLMARMHVKPTPKLPEKAIVVATTKERK